MGELRMREALRDAMREELIRDPNLILLGEDIAAYGGSYSVTKGLLEEFGEHRVIDTPIAESVMVGAGVGAGMGGIRCMVEIMTINFAFVAFDQIVNSAAKIHYMSNGQLKIPITIRMASGAGSQLAATHSHDTIGLFAHFPGLYVACPSTPEDAKGMLKRALRMDDPVIFIEHTALYGLKGDVPDGDYLTPFGEAVIRRPGDDVTLIGYSGSVHQAMRAAEYLAEDGLEAEVIDLRTVRPLDMDTIIESVKKTNRAVIVEDDWRFGGFGAELSAQIMENAFDWLDAPVGRVACEDVPMPYNMEMEFAALPTEEDVANAVVAMF